MEEKVTENNEVNKSNKIKIIVLTLLVFFIAISGITYAYFSIQIRGNEEASSMSLVTANLSLIYTDLQVRSGEDVIPGWSTTKTITVENDGTDTAYYNIIWRELYNEIEEQELIIYATCTASTGTCDDMPETVVYDTDGIENNLVIMSNIPIESGVTHTYLVTVEFIETGSNQNYNQNKEFYGTLNINESTATTSGILMLEVPSGVDYVEMHSDPVEALVEEGYADFGSVTFSTSTTYHTFIGYDSNDEEVFRKQIGFKIDPSLPRAGNAYLNGDIMNISVAQLCVGGGMALRTFLVSLDSNYDIDSVDDTCLGSGYDGELSTVSSIDLGPITPKPGPGGLQLN